MHGLKSGSCRIWQLTDSPPGSNMLRLAYADSGSACKLAGVQIIPLPTLANQILARTFFRSVAHLFACPAVEKFCRASSAGGRLHLQSNSVQLDRVGRRGLSEPGGIFSRLLTYAFPWLYPWLSPRLSPRIQTTTPTSHPARNFATNFLSLEPNNYKNRSGNRPQKSEAHAEQAHQLCCRLRHRRSGIVTFSIAAI